MITETVGAGGMASLFTFLGKNRDHMNMRQGYPIVRVENEKDGDPKNYFHGESGNPNFG